MLAIRFTGAMTTIVEDARCLLLPAVPSYTVPSEAQMVRLAAPAREAENMSHTVEAMRFPTLLPSPRRRIFESHVPLADVARSAMRGNEGRNLRAGLILE